MHKTFDSDIRRQVVAIDVFNGLTVRGGCGGHPDPQPDQWLERAWYVRSLWSSISLNERTVDK
jgi:hypothetical protein